MTAGRVLSRLLLLAALATAAVLARPYVERLVRLVRLVTADPPTRLPLPLETVGPEVIADT